jgi:hypothetical protein
MKSRLVAAVVLVVIGLVMLLGSHHLSQSRFTAGFIVTLFGAVVMGFNVMLRFGTALLVDLGGVMIFFLASTGTNDPQVQFPMLVAGCMVLAYTLPSWLRHARVSSDA